MRVDSVPWLGNRRRRGLLTDECNVSRAASTRLPFQAVIAYTASADLLRPGPSGLSAETSSLTPACRARDHMPRIGWPVRRPLGSPAASRHRPGHLRSRRRPRALGSIGWAGASSRSIRAGRATQELAGGSVRVAISEGDRGRRRSCRRGRGGGRRAASRGLHSARCRPAISPRVLGAVLADAGLYVGNDSGVSHLAAAWGAPVLALFGPTDPALWAPVGPRVNVLRAKDEKMESLELQDVERAAREMLDPIEGQAAKRRFTRR